MSSQQCWRAAVGWMIAAVLSCGSAFPVNPAVAQAAAVRLEPVVVTATRTSLAQTAPASATVLDATQLDSSANVAVDDILRAIPGFSLYRRSSSAVTSPNLDPEAQGVTLRGIGPSGASRALVMVDGVPLVDAFDGQVYWGKIAKESIERIEVVRGALSSLWGNYAMAGVINIITRKPQRNGVFAKATYGTHGLTDDHLALSARHEALSIGLEGHFFNTDGFPIVARQQRGPIDDRYSSRYEQFNGRVQYALNDRARVELHGQFFDDVHSNGTTQRHSATRAGLIDANTTWRDAADGEWQLMLFSNSQSFHIQFSELSEGRSREHRTLQQTVPYSDVGSALTWSQRLSPPLLLTAGADVHWIDGQSLDRRFDVTGTGVEELQRSDGKQFFGGLLAQAIYEPTADWQIALGGRVDAWSNYDGTQSITHDDGTIEAQRFEAHSEASFNPRLSVLYQATQWLALRAAAYRAFRAPTLAELYRESAVEGLKLLPNPDLTAERLSGAELGVDLPLLANLDARATGFWADIEDPVTNVDQPEAVCGESQPVGGGGQQEDGEAGLCRKRVNLGLARTVGAELDVLYEPHRDVTLYGSYLFADARVERAPQERQLEGRKLAQIPPHTFTLGARFDEPRWFTFNVEGRFVDDQFEDADENELLSSYFIVNGSVQRRLPGVDGEVFVAAENLLDRTYNVDRGGGIFKTGTPLAAHGGVRLRF